MSKKKIIIINDDFPPFSSGGAAIIAYNQAFGLKERGFDVVVLTTVNEIKNEGVFYEGDIKIIKIYYKYNLRYRAYVSIYNRYLSKKLKSVLIEERPDIVHFHNIHLNFSYHCLYIAKKICNNVFLTVHDSMPFHYSKLFPKNKLSQSKDNYKVSAFMQIKDFKFRYNPFRNILIKYYLKFPKKIIAVSNALKEALEVNGISNVVTIHNGININQWIIDREKVNEFKSKYNLNDKRVLMFCGRLSRAKGGEVIIKALADIIKSIPDTRLLIVGEMDTEAQNLFRTAKQLGIKEYIIFTGKLDRKSIINAYGSSDLVVVPSLCFDWFPTVNLEAMALGIPVIATCLGGSKEIISDGINGYIINPYNSSEIVNKILNLLGDDVLIKKMSIESETFIKVKVSHNVLINNYINIYDKFY